MPTVVSSQQALKLNFQEDTLTTVSRDALKAMAKKLGFNETQTILFALARLRDEIFNDQELEKFMPLTRKHHEEIAKAEPRRRGKVLDSLL